MSESILGAVQEYLSECPLFEDNMIRVNFLGEKPLEYTLEDVPSTPIVKQYTSGAYIGQALFVIASREFYGRDAIENLKASGFYEKLAAWLDQQTRARNLPALPEGMIPQRIEAITNGYCFAADIQENLQRYQIQCKITFFQEVKNYA